jgi:hypothetical protein
MERNELIGLLDRAILVAASVVENCRDDRAWMVDDARNALEKFRQIRDAAIAGQLPRSSGAGLGITRALGEWAPDELYEAGKAVEDFYKEKWA